MRYSTKAYLVRCLGFVEILRWARFSLGLRIDWSYTSCCVQLGLAGRIWIVRHLNMCDYPAASNKESEDYERYNQRKSSNNTNSNDCGSRKGRVV
jgi:hypothetical protein